MPRSLGLGRGGTQPMTGRRDAAPARDRRAAATTGSWSPRPARRACAARPGSARSPTSGSHEPCETRAHAPRDQEEGDPSSGAGMSTSAAQAHDANAQASAATPGTPPTAPAAAIGSQPQAAPGHNASATAVRRSGEAHEAGGEAQRSPPPTPPAPSDRQPVESIAEPSD